MVKKYSKLEKQDKEYLEKKKEVKKEKVKIKNEIKKYANWSFLI